jgi:hypothetical protein
MVNLKKKQTGSNTPRGIKMKNRPKAIFPRKKTKKMNPLGYTKFIAKFWKESPGIQKPDHSGSTVIKLRRLNTKIL